MIPFSFIYCRPDSLKEAADIYRQLRTEGKAPVYYAGGSEIITMCRSGSIRPDAVIDIKNIPECTALAMDGQVLTIGTACTLNQIKESKLFPLLGLACGRIADHTNQCRITLGGNLCGTIIYRETSLPLLLSDADLVLYGEKGKRTVLFHSVFRGRMQLDSGELAVQVRIPGWALQAHHAHVKITANEKIDYPLVDVAAIRKDNFLRTAFSGVCSHPFRSKEMEAVLNDRSLPYEVRADKAVKLLPEPAYGDVEGTGAYRIFVLKNTLRKLLEDWENDQI
ncbi:FAD binding domain-containing protein [Caproiciproducens sp. R1]|uniref:FAD binding domain-containing protein n=1 Tax=Caproiciproducens sp. R1 TaxID=3435000 RepID=UPI0040345E50